MSSLFHERPDFLGPYEIQTMDGEIRLLELAGAFMDGLGKPIYIQDVNGTVYNYDNIISFKKRPRV